MLSIYKQLGGSEQFDILPVVDVIACLEDLQPLEEAESRALDEMSRKIEMMRLQNGGRY